MYRSRLDGPRRPLPDLPTLEVENVRDGRNDARYEREQEPSVLEAHMVEHLRDP